LSTDSSRAGRPRGHDLYRRRMFGLVDALAILVLAGIGFAVSPATALPAVVWIAFATPALARADVSRRRLPNALTLPAVALVVACSLVELGTDAGAQEPRSALVALTATALTGWLVSRTGALGLGDVKLATALVGSVVLVAPAEAWVFAGVTAAAGAGAALWGSRGRGGRSDRGLRSRDCRRCGALRGADAGTRVAMLGIRLHGGLRGGTAACAPLATLGIGRRGGPRQGSAVRRAGVPPESRVRGQGGSAAAVMRPGSIPYGPCLLLGYWSALLVDAVT
jgi:leader peptidase (prepilin peptidase)/N-methyltransferase